MKIRSRYEVYVPSAGMEFVELSQAQQHFKDECDINNIIASFDTTGVMPSGTAQPVFGDFSGVPDLADTYASLISAKSDFDHLPLKIRERFNYDPERFLAFVSNPDNLDEMVSLGLAEKHETSVLSTGGEPSPDDSPASGD